MTTISTGSSVLDALANSSTASATATPKDNQTIDQAGFLKLLTTQLTTQDPTAPADTNQMVQQMATFSQVAGITEMNTSMKAMSSDLAAARFGDASGWIGRAALVKSDTLAALSNGGYAGQVTLPVAAKSMTVSLVDQNGQTVYARDLGAQPAGDVQIGWDGKDQAGNAVAGPLTAVVQAVSAAGASITPTVQAWTEVQSVQSPAAGTTKLVTPLGQFAPADISQLS